MRQIISGLVAAIAVMLASAAPAMACGGLFGGGCSPCGYVSPCAQAYVPVYSGCYSGCGGWGYPEQLADPVQQYGVAPMASPQYYYADQGPSYSGPGDFAPYPTYQEGSYHQRPYGYGYNGGYRSHPRYGAYTGYHNGPRDYAPRQSMRYGYGAPRHYGYGHHYGYRERVLRRYY